MNRIKAWGIGLGVGVVAAGAVLGAEAVLSRVTAPACPTGWTEVSPPSIPGATALRACAHGESAGATPVATVGLYRSADQAERVRDAALRATVAAAASHGAHASSDAPTAATAAQGRLAVSTQTLDAGELPLEADVYLVAAGHRFGLLNIVHTTGAPFAAPAATAAWMSTIEGVSPWGAPDAGPLRARCPEGFESRAAEGARAVVRCITGLGTPRFTLLSLSWDEGGFGSEADRTRVATAIATRVASSQGAAARVVEGPTPFTLARNVDAMRTRVETGEHVPVGLRAMAATAVNGSNHTIGIAYGESDEVFVPVLAAMFRDSGATRPPPWIDGHRAWVLAAAFMALGIVMGAVFARGKIE